MVQTFRPVVENTDLSIVSNPAWPRVAVVCRWKDAHKRRNKWPNAAVVGPLRTVRGIDLLVRSLLANPQIRVVIVDGADLSAGQMTTEALLDLWRDGSRPRGMADDLTDDLISVVRESVTLIDGEQVDLAAFIRVHDEDRPGGRVVLPPPPPTSTATAPHGDPGERVAGFRLSDVWPSVLQRILNFGFEVPSKYGATREVLNLVSVFRNPRGILSEVEKSPWLGFTRDQVDEYARRVTTPWAPDGAPYSYGTRIGADGFDGVTHLLSEKVRDRGIGVSPWHSSDVTRGSGRPCLTWVQFRHIGDQLHLQFVFRSHDYFGAYPMNVAALASWLVREADAAGLEVGTMTCLSVSAHLYDRDWGDALEVVANHLPGGHQWDERTTWKVEATDDGIRAVALTPDGVEVVGVFEGRTPEAVQRKIERAGLCHNHRERDVVGPETGRSRPLITVDDRMSWK